LCALAALGLAPLIPATAAPLALVAGLLVLTGLLFAPLTTCQLALIDDVAPRGAATEAMAVLGTAYGACSAAGAQAAGVLIDGPGLRAPFVAACACIAVAAVLATARRQSLLPRPTAPPTRATIERA
jgi:predicted MFS family arabinose efflux permease